MSVKKWSVVLGIIVIASMVLTRLHGPGAPGGREGRDAGRRPRKKQVVQTQVVEKDKIVEKQSRRHSDGRAEARRCCASTLARYPDIIDPQKSSFVNEIAHLKLMYEGLTKLDKNLEDGPRRGREVEYNADATELTFTSASGPEVQRRQPLNAARYKYSIKRNINPETAGEYAQITDEIKGAPEWRGFAADDKKTEEENAKAAGRRRRPSSTERHHGLPVRRQDACAAEGHLQGCRLHRPELTPTLTLLQAGPVLPHRDEPVGHLPGQGRKHHGRRRELVEQLQVPDRQRPLHPEEPRAVRQGRLHAERRTTGATRPRSTSSTPTSPTALWPSRPTRTTSSTSIACGAEDLEDHQGRCDAEQGTAKVYPGSCTFAVMFHQLKEPFTDPKVREAFAQCLRPRGLGEGRADGPGRADPHLDPARVPWVRRDREPLGLQPGSGQEGPRRVHVRQRRQAAAHQADLLRHARATAPATSGWRPSGRKSWAST